MTIPKKSLAEVCATALAAKIYKDCIRYYPFVLGSTWPPPMRRLPTRAPYRRPTRSTRSRSMARRFQRADESIGHKAKAGAKTVNLALQGGDSHGAFTWGVLDRLLEDWY